VVPLIGTIEVAPVGECGAEGIGRRLLVVIESGRKAASMSIGPDAFEESSHLLLSHLIIGCDEGRIDELFIEITKDEGVGHGYLFGM
jgi:hypothetical protein